MVEKMNDRNGLNFLSMYTRAYTWPRALETSPCTTGAGNRLDNTATRSRALQPTVLARISACLRALPCSLPRAQPRRGCEIGARGRGNAFVIVLPTEARELVARPQCRPPQFPEEGREGRGRGTSFL